MAEIECAGCEATIDEDEATSLAELYGVNPPGKQGKFCDDCIDRFESEPSFVGL